MSISKLSDQSTLLLDLALRIDDPAGIEAIDLAAEIIKTFENRSEEQCVAMRQSLWRWAKQWPRPVEPETEHTMCQAMCLECGKPVDWTKTNSGYPLCPDCDSSEPLPSVRPNEHCATQPIVPIE